MNGNDELMRRHMVPIWADDHRTHFQARCEDCGWQGSVFPAAQRGPKKGREAKAKANAERERESHKAEAGMVTA